MSSIQHVSDLLAHADEILCGAVLDDLRTVDDRHIVEAAALTGALLRRVEATLIELVDVIDARSHGLDDERLDLAYGCRNSTELLERLTALSPGTIRKFMTASKLIKRRESLTSGDLPPVLPAIRHQLLDGTIGLDGLLAISGPIREVHDRVPATSIAAVDEELAQAVHDDPSTGCMNIDGRNLVLPTSAGLLKVYAMTFAYAIDQDGAEPVERQARRNRSLTLGHLKDGLVPITGNLLPDVAAGLQTIIDATSNPHGKAAGVRFRDGSDDDNLDDRTPGQARHDALAIAVTVAAASRELPTLGGAAPTLVVTVTAESLTQGNGWAEIQGMSVPLSSAIHTGCGGHIQRVVFDGDGRIVQTTTTERLFNAAQRRAIAARDGGCVIPGCSVPAAWTEVHHVTPWATQQTKKTDVNDGCLLCWHHHRFLDRSGWSIQIRRESVFVKPPGWLDSTGRWRAVKQPPLALAA